MAQAKLNFETSPLCYLCPDALKLFKNIYGATIVTKIGSYHTTLNLRQFELTLAYVVLKIFLKLLVDRRTYSTDRRTTRPTDRPT